MTGMGNRRHRMLLEKMILKSLKRVIPETLFQVNITEDTERKTNFRVGNSW